MTRTDTDLQPAPAAVDVPTEPPDRPPIVAETARFQRLRRSRAMRRLLRNRGAAVSLAFILLLVVVAVLAPVLAPQDPNAQDVSSPLAGPGGDYLLGSDLLGRDTLSRLLHGTGVTLLAGLQGLGFALVLGIPLGLLAGYAGGLGDALLSRLADAFLSLPPLVFALAVIGILGPGLTNAMIAVGILMAPRFFRVTRAAAQGIRHETYIEAYRSVGVSTPRLLWRHVIPNASGPLLVQATFGVGIVISIESSLSFLGLGVQLPQSSWGSMLQSAFQSINRDTFQLVPPAVMITLTVLAFFTLGDAVSDALGRSSKGE